jgi:serine protease AprX
MSRPMAMIRVLVQAFQPGAVRAAGELLESSIVEGSLAYGLIDEGLVHQLEELGGIVRPLGPPLEPEPSIPERLGPHEEPEPEVPTGPSQPPVVQTFRVMPDWDMLGVNPDEVPPFWRYVWIVQLAGPIFTTWRERLSAVQVELLERLWEDYYTARIPSTSLTYARNELEFLRVVRPYTIRDTIHPGHLALAGDSTTGADEVVSFDLLLHPGTELSGVETVARTLGLTVVYARGRWLRFYAERASTALVSLAQLPDVAAINEHVAPRVTNDVARGLLGVDHATMTPSVGALTGKGQILGVADTGIDAGHPDLQGRIDACVARGRRGNATDPTGHGTHVAGSIAGDGTASGGSFRGVAPEAGLFFQSVMDGGGHLTGLEPSLRIIYEEAYQAGARIHNDSWGVNFNGSAYPIQSWETDEFARDFPDMLVVCSAGNDGTAANPLNAQVGYVDWRSLDSPGTAKNALTVGASRTARQGMIASGATTWGEYDPQRFPEPPIANEQLAGDPESIAAISGRGPCDVVERIKPDVVAPGTFILSARASTGVAKEFWDSYPPNPKYGYMGGTSMATALVTGCAALVRQYFVEGRNHHPSGALLKAVLINGARWLCGKDAIADHPDAPNYHQGFGSVHLPDSIPNENNRLLKLEFHDEWRGDRFTFTSVGQTFPFDIVASSSIPLRICLTWSDPPDRVVQNILTLTVQLPEAGIQWMGNTHRPQLIKKDVDDANNVQVVRLMDPKPGAYRIYVSAANLSPREPAQRFALVVTGDLKSSLTPIS